MGITMVPDSNPTSSLSPNSTPNMIPYLTMPKGSAMTRDDDDGHDQHTGDDGDDQNDQEQRRQRHQE